MTNLKTGTQVIVRINDRGPFHSTRIIDLSYTAALKLGYLSSGSSELEVERLLPDEINEMAANRKQGITTVASTPSGQQPAPVAAVPEAVTLGAVTTQTLDTPVMVATAAPSAARPTDAALASGFYLQFGAYSQETNARIARDKLLQSLSGAVDKVEAVAVNGLYRLYAGPYTSRPAAQDAAQIVRQRSSITPFVVER